MAAEVRRGLTASPPWLPSKYFYDEQGGRLFEEITELPEYYLTRTEEAILRARADDVVARLRPRELVELGAGTSPKLRLLLDAMRHARVLRRCVLVDINAGALRASARRLASLYPGLDVQTIVTDFQDDLSQLGAGGGRLLAFLGSTIGNLHPTEVSAFLGGLASHLSPGDGLLLGVDLVKDKARLEAAYDDPAGVTAAFNLNILKAINAQLGAGFRPGDFEHVSFYDEEQAWIEMRLRAVRTTRARIPPASLDLTFVRGDEIRTEISCKFTRASLEQRLGPAGLQLQEWMTDPEGLFALALLVPLN